MTVQYGYYAWFLLLWSSSWKPSHAAADSFERGENLSPQHTLTSPNGDFVFGFFNLSDDTSSKPRWYVGIWYAKADPFTVAWVANRDSPVSAELLSSSFVTITNQSSLQLTTNGSTIWSTEPSGKLAAAAKIQNDGNLVLVAAENRSGEPLWQSFDMLGDTWLPGMKMGNNGQYLCAWESLWNPAKGSFCLHMNPDGRVQLTWNGSFIYWDAGVWDGHKYSKVAAMGTIQDFYRFRFVVLGSYKYFVVWYCHPGQQPLSRFWLHPSGQLQVLALLNDGSWGLLWAAPSNPCDVYAACGAFASCNSNNSGICSCVAGHRPLHQRAWDAHDWHGGCVRNTPLSCAGHRPLHQRAWDAHDWHGGCVRNTPHACAGDDFVKIQSSSLPPGGATKKRLLSLESCRDECLANCFCTAFAIINGSSSSTCLHWINSDLLNLRDDVGGTQTQDFSLFLRLNSRDITCSLENHHCGTARKAGRYASIAAAGTGSSLVAVVTVWISWRRRMAKKRGSAVPASLKVFSYKELRVATREFSQRIGVGGFGSVFKGTLPDALRTDVAVKKLEGDTQGEKEFRAEVATVGQVQHVNVVRLLGFCSEHRHRLLVYEFVRNGSLSSWLFGPGPGLDWKTRFSVAVGAARALEYLHEQCRERIIHCDIKPENILLDAQFNAKVADFGLAKLLGRDLSGALTTVRGTRGYLAPEWLSGEPITAKADVYSFGMTLLDIVTGRRTVGDVPSSGFFAEKAAAEICSGNATAVLDRRLVEDPSVEEEEVRRVAWMALWCIQEDEAARPHMRDVLQVLQGVKEAPNVAPPVPPSMQSADVDSEASPSLVFFWEHESHGDNAEENSHDMGW